MPHWVQFVAIAVLLLCGCGKQETSAERRQREALDLCYKAVDRLKANDKATAESLLKQAIAADPFCEKAKEVLASMKGGVGAIETAKTQIALFKTQLAAYRADVDTFPTDLEALRTVPRDLASPEKWKGPYAKSGLPLDPWGNPYQYSFPGIHSPKSYDLWTLGPDGINGTEDDIGSW